MRARMNVFGFETALFCEAWVVDAFVGEAKLRCC